LARILLIDDEEGHRDFVAVALQRMGHEVTSESSGLPVVSKAGRVDFSAMYDVVITDLVMPEIEGIEVIRSLKAASPACRIIAMSGGGRYNASDDYLKLAMRLGVKTTLAKPFTIADLRDAVSTAISAI
jgi:DNA-binding NtrC family response regulator